MIKDILLDILAIPSPSGNEQLLTKKFADFVAPMVDRVTVDTIGNVIAYRKGNGSGKRVMIVAHADEVAMMVTYIDDNGFVHFQEVGAVDTNILPEQIVEIHHVGKTVAGVIGKKPLHLQEKSEYAKDWATEELWIDLGVKSKAEAEKLVEVGDYITYKTQPFFLQSNNIVSKSLDDKSGLAVMMEVAQCLKDESVDDDIYFVASVQEELGARGAQVAAQSIKPDIAIAVDTTHAVDYPSVSPERIGDISLGKGVVVTKGPNIDLSLAQQLTKIARESDINFQLQAISHQTGSDINPIQLVEAGVKTALLSIPLRYMHSPNEVACLEDMMSAGELLKKFCMSSH
ncbi:hydrolase [Prevotella lacticifex]|jgi:endoglucanase|uniref:M42 family metallopeptidase n=1 Tax=Prevotella lacticifex TaxID=2854755 RepID=UPI001CC5FCC9|nr:M20/M25/M40 family metallo-hydrolase [Prevotella lacticifex]GJG69150.1 hydrolase [Prevotella lacticifex]